MGLADVFNSDVFSVQSLTSAINKLPHKPSRIGDMGLFTEQGVRTTTVVLEEKDGLLSLLPTKQRGAPSSVGTGEKRTARSFTIPHIPYDDAIMADDVLNLRAFGSETELASVSSTVNDRLTRMKQEHEVTLEHLRIGAVKGVILDADGATELFDLFALYGISQTTVDFALDQSATIVRAKCLESIREIEVQLGAAPYDHIHAFCGADFMDSLIDHDDVRIAYARYQDGSALRDDPRGGFTFAGITFEEYRGAVGGIDFVSAEEAHLFPVGTPNLFLTYFAPANFMEAVGTVGLPLYAKKAMMKLDIGVQLHTQSNPLPLCTRPATLIKATV